MREKWDAYNEKWEKLNYFIFRDSKLEKGVYHLICEVLIFHSDGDILLMKRSLNKESYPGYYEASAGGSALAGESALEAAIREVREETGIKDGIFTEIGKSIFYDDNCLNVSFKCITNIDKDKIILQENETIAYKWISKNDYKDLLYGKKFKDLKLIEYKSNRHKKYFFNE